MREIVEKLWQIIDDIDTMDDWARDDDAAFRIAVMEKVKERWSSTGIISDGYSLIFPGDEAKNNV